MKDTLKYAVRAHGKVCRCVAAQRRGNLNMLQLFVGSLALFLGVSICEHYNLRCSNYLAISNFLVKTTHIMEYGLPYIGF